MPRTKAIVQVQTVFFKERQACCSENLETETKWRQFRGALHCAHVAMCNISLFGGGSPDLVICRDWLQFNFYDFNVMQLNEKKGTTMHDFWKSRRFIKYQLYHVFTSACLKNNSLVFHHTKAEGKPIYNDQHLIIKSSRIKNILTIQILRIKSFKAYWKVKKCTFLKGQTILISAKESESSMNIVYEYT